MVREFLVLRPLDIGVGVALDIRESRQSKTTTIAIMITCLLSAGLCAHGMLGAKRENSSARTSRMLRLRWPRAVHNAHPGCACKHTRTPVCKHRASETTVTDDLL